MADKTRKPVPAVRELAEQKLNRFLKENKILIGTGKPEIELTQSGSMIIHSPGIIAVYEDSLKKNDKLAN